MTPAQRQWIEREAALAGESISEFVAVAAFARAAFLRAQREGEEYAELWDTAATTLRHWPAHDGPIQ